MILSPISNKCLYFIINKFICIDQDGVEGNPVRVLQWNVLSQGNYYYY